MKAGLLMKAGLACMLLAACNSDMALEEEAKVKGSKTLKIEVADEIAATGTRAVYSGFPSTAFEEGDAIGMYVFDGSSYVRGNVRFVKQADGSWEPDSEVPYDEGYTYYAYFPYSEDVYTPSTSGTTDAVDMKFSSFISDASNYFWQADQSTKAGFTYSNLMIARGRVTDTDEDAATVKFTMAHKRGLAVFGTGVESFGFTGNLPYLQSGTGYFLMKPDTPTSFTDGTDTYSLSAWSGEYVSQSFLCPVPYLRFTAEEAGTFRLSIPSRVTTTYLQEVSYSLDEGKTWNKTDNTSSNVTINTPEVAAGKSVLWKGIGNAYGNATYNSKFTATCSFSVSGNIMSLLYGDDFDDQTTLESGYAFQEMFDGNNKITSAENLVLPATTITTYCYCKMFCNCTSLTAAPELPATTVAPRCYFQMFQGCTSLVKAPGILPCTNLESKTSAYDSMFKGCTSLETAPILPEASLTSSQNVYSLMFYGCSSLRYIKYLGQSLGTSNHPNWVKNVSSEGTFVKNPLLTSWDTGDSGIPSGWTVIDSED